MKVESIDQGSITRGQRSFVEAVLSNNDYGH